jgi:DNA-binding phage protein
MVGRQVAVTVGQTCGGFVRRRALVGASGPIFAFISGRSSPKRKPMARRPKDWDEYMFEDLSDPVFTSELVKGLVESGMPIRAAVRDVINGLGVKEFAALVGMASSNLVRAVHPKANPTLATIERLLEPLGLRIGVAYRSGVRRTATRRARPRRVA